jgi:methylated-DNA-[protein]-cysteine S-methyltransferase
MPAQPPVYDAVLTTPIGPIGVVTDGRSSVLRIDLRADPRIQISMPRPGPAAAAVLDWLAAYFRDPATPVPSLSFGVRATFHQQCVWSALRRIPRARVRSYGELARSLRSSPRAVGQACRSNPLPLLIPCHRVVSAQGLGGFMGAERALVIKQWLLEHEGAL